MSQDESNNQKTKQKVYAVHVTPEALVDAKAVAAKIDRPIRWVVAKALRMYSELVMTETDKKEVLAEAKTRYYAEATSIEDILNDAGN